MSLSPNSEWVVVFGGPRRERTVLEFAANRHVRAVVVPRPQTPQLARSIDELRRSGLAVVETGKDDLDDNLGSFRDLALLSVGFPYILPAAILDRHAVKINVHPTLLPAYRGPTSGYYIVANNEKKSGVTVHWIEPEVDSGDIVAQRSFSVDRFDTVRSVQRKAYAIEPDLLLEAVARLESGLPSEAQDETKASIYPQKRKPADSEIDPGKSLTELYDSIRACDPDAYPAFFLVEGQKVCIRLWRPERPAADGEDTL